MNNSTSLLNNKNNSSDQLRDGTSEGVKSLYTRRANQTERDRTSIRTLHIRDKSHKAQKSQKYKGLFAYLDLLTETFDPIVLLYPFIFQQIGFIYASHILLASTLFLGLSCKLMLEGTRLQPSNL